MCTHTTEYSMQHSAPSKPTGCHTLGYNLSSLPQGSISNGPKECDTQADHSREQWGGGVAGAGGRALDGKARRMALARQRYICPLFVAHVVRGLATWRCSRLCSVTRMVPSRQDPTACTRRHFAALLMVSGNTAMVAVRPPEA